MNALITQILTTHTYVSQIRIYLNSLIQQRLQGTIRKSAKKRENGQNGMTYMQIRFGLFILLHIESIFHRKRDT